ncbi:MAG: outer membrane beta-barrel domain-containing protein [Myxococcaceae bacterium]|nr:outer membrane beta-barrel domain-containing protein [Myxococcaceae bacterium]
MLRAFVLAAVTLTGASAFAQKQPANDPSNQQLIENVVVRNRLYTVKNRFELTPQVGLTIVNALTEHYNFNVGVAYNVSETLAFELQGGYAYSRHTNLANDVAAHLLERNPAPATGSPEVKITSDMKNLWQMQGNGVIGVRWAPLYGKLSLMAELPVHFQAYLWGGGGAGNFFRESIVYCQGGVTNRNGDNPECGNGFRTDRAVKWIGSVAFGMRFFTHRAGAIKLEIRDYTWPDSFLVDIDRAVAEQNGQTGTDSPNPGLTNLVLFNLGYSFLF